MAMFETADALYAVLDPFFRRVSEEASLADALLRSEMVLRFRYREPEGQATVDLRRAPLTWTLGPCELEPDLEMIQSADTAHTFWLGRLSVPRALATRQVVARGPVRKALALLPALEPAYPLYAQVLREQGRVHLIPEAQMPGRASRWWEVLRRALGRGHRRSASGDAPTAPPERILPVIDPDSPTSAHVFRDPGLPTDPAALRRLMLDRMYLIRAFEERLSAAYAAGEVPTEAIHLSIGQEATAVGVCFALRGDDYIATTHRGHGHMLAKGADLDGMMAELLARADGLCAGKGGSMHVTEAAVGAIGANGIVGASPLIASGAAHSARLRGTDQVAVAFLGDGATNQGMFHEAVNFAAVLDLPVVFLVENNLYGEFTPLDRHVRVAHLADRAAAYGIPGVVVDGNDAEAVYEATATAVARARRGEGPTLLECLTYRWHGHMEGEDVPYRPAEEIARWKRRCPIARLRQGLVDEGALDHAGADAAQAEAQARVDAAWARAVALPEPSLDALTTDVFAPEPPEVVGGVEPPKGDRQITCSMALFEAVSEELSRDDAVYLLGEDVTTGGYFAVTTGLVDEFGAERIVDTPISEYAIVGSAVGAAMTGRRPIAEILFSDFLTTCMDPLVNQAAKLRYMSGGQYALPMVVRTPGGAGLGMAAQHSQSLEALLTGIPGLIIVAPSTPYDAKGLLKAAIRSNNPVVFFENKLQYAQIGPVPEGEYVVPLGVADIKRPGRDVTVVTVGAALGKALEAAEVVAARGVDAEVVDVRSLVPLDLPTIVASVRRTGALVTVEEGPLGHGFGGEIVARVVEAAFDALRAPPRRIAARDIPLPYNSALENAALPQVDDIASALCAAARR